MPIFPFPSLLFEIGAAMNMIFCDFDSVKIDLVRCILARRKIHLSLDISETGEII